MFWIPRGWVPYYVEWIMSFPRAPLGSISIQVWWIACASIIALVAEALGAVIALATGRTADNQQKEPMMMAAAGDNASKEKKSTAAGGEKKEL